jgi:CRISPR system Cascade subunit CasD
MDVLILRFDAPLMAFGGVAVDQISVTDRFPSLSMLAGLFGNALGYEHKDFDKLQRLQERIEFSARWDVEPERLVDYHTVNLGQEKMVHDGWTTRGKPEHRAGGSASEGTHIRLRHYLANGVMTIAVSLTGDDAPSTATLGEAIQQPARPLFIGRKTCLPSTPIFLSPVNADNTLSALKPIPRHTRPGAKPKPKMSACWPVSAGEPENSETRPVYGLRDWSNQIHAGRTERVEGLLEVEAP